MDRRDFAEHVYRFILAFDELRDDFDKLTGSPADLLSDDDEGYVQGDFLDTVEDRDSEQK